MKIKEETTKLFLFLIYLNTKDTSPCQSNPCLNGGICLANANTCSFSCTCQTSFTGPFCAQSIICIFRVNSKNLNLIKRGAFARPRAPPAYFSMKIYNIKIMFLEKNSLFL